MDQRSFFGGSMAFGGFGHDRADPADRRFGAIIYEI
jgi:hypothetical protein